MRKRPLRTVTMLLALLALVVLPTAAWAATTQRIYRLYNQWNGEHLFTGQTALFRNVARPDCGFP